MSYVRVFSVERVQSILLKSNPPALAIRADGTVNSSGWTEPQLSEWVYITPPADGVLDLDFIARKPQGIVLWMTMPIHADLVLRPVDVANYWGKDQPLRGIRVHSASSSLTDELGSSPKAVRFATLVAGDRWPW